MTRDSEYNPYAPPEADVASRAPATSEAHEALRRELIPHETSIRGIGALYYLSFGLSTLAAIAVLTVGLSTDSPDLKDLRVFLFVAATLYGLLALLLFYLARGLRRLDRRVRIPVTIVSAIGLLGFPLGTLINGYILYLVHSDKGKRVMTPEYQVVVEQTPHIRYQTPVWLYVVAALIIVVAVLVLVVAVSS